MKKKPLRAALVVGLLLILLCFGLWGYVQAMTYRALPDAIMVLGMENVRRSAGTLIFEPAGPPLASLVFYQGGLVESSAYAVMAQMLSEQGIRVFLPRMPFDLAILDAQRINRIRVRFDEGESWYLAGHSLGGATATIHAHRQPEGLSGLILLAAYPADRSDLSEAGIPVLSITGSMDGVINPIRFEAGRALLPSDTRYIEIAGGNHANFGYYGDQRQDGQAAIPRETQHRLVVEAIVEMIMGHSK